MYFNLTLRKMFQIAGLPEPQSFDDVLDEAIVDISNVNQWKTKEGLRVFVGFTFESVTLEEYLKMIKEGIVVITYKPILEENGNRAKMILLNSFDEMKTLWSSLGRWMHDQIKLPTITITGSVGKTTTTAFLEKIFAEKYKVFATAGNLNNIEFIVREMLRGLNDSYTMHIQEIGGGVPNSVKNCTKMLEPDAFVITTILPHHMSGYKTFERIVEDKTGMDANSAEKAFGVINVDNEALRDHEFKHRVVRCGIENTDADYVAVNVRQDGVWLKMDVYMRESGQSVSVEAQIPETHNAYNMLLAFATAKEYGIDEAIICKGIKNYKSDFIRQNFTVVSGRLFYVDCFNHAVDSIKSALKFVQEAKLEEGKRKIAVLGGENALGNKAFSVNYSLGLTFHEYDDIDEFIFFGLPENASKKEIDFVGDAHAVYLGTKRVVRNRKVSYCSSIEELATKLKDETNPGDLILLKGIVHKPLWPVVDLAFGTALTMRSAINRTTKEVKDNNCRGIFYGNVNGINLSKGRFVNGKLYIPDTIQEEPVFRIGRDNFRNHHEIKAVDFGHSLVNVGARAFKNCSGIEEVELPISTLFLEEEAFADCANLKKVIMHGVEHISSGVFSNCPSLEYVKLPKSCIHIADDAFDNIDNVQIESDSEYAREWIMRRTEKNN